MAETTAKELWQQAASQVNVVNNLAALETQADVADYTLEHLIADLQAADIALSTNTLNGLAALKLIAAQSSIKDADITTPATSVPIQATISRKSVTRTLQVAYYALKAKLGL